MEDNNYRHEDFDDCFLCKHPALRHVLTGLLVFLGAFAAFYVVSDWHFKRMMDPMLQMRRMDRALMRDEHRFDKMARKELHRQLRMERHAAQFVHVEKTEDAYKIIIDLRPFDNNEKNVEVRTEGNTVIINAAGEKNTRHKQEIMKYSQAFAFGEDINANNITKVREGDNYIITVPFD
ncbi:unknown [Fusobacterium sp. CAG:439]|nr:unknown [Fusobacterium sp. CAG:439]